MKSPIISSAWFILVLITISSCNKSKPEIFQTEGQALAGHDAVAFLSKNEALLGKVKYSIEWKNATWLFANQANLDKFKENPALYTPQYGGYCAYGTSQGYKAPVEIETWSVVDGKLYFNYNQEVKVKWNKDQSGYIDKADHNWMEIK